MIAFLHVLAVYCLETRCRVKSGNFDMYANWRTYCFSSYDSILLQQLYLNLLLRRHVLNWRISNENNASILRENSCPFLSAHRFMILSLTVLVYECMNQLKWAVQKGQYLCTITVVAGRGFQSVRTFRPTNPFTKCYTCISITLTVIDRSMIICYCYIFYWSKHIWANIKVK